MLFKSFAKIASNHNIILNIEPISKKYKNFSLISMRLEVHKKITKKILKIVLDR